MSDITIAGATFSDVTKIQIPKSGSGTAEFLEVSGSQEITQNDTYDVSALAQVVVNVAGGGGGGDLEEKSVTITENGTSVVEPSAGKDGLSKVTVIVSVADTIVRAHFAYTFDFTTYLEDVSWNCTAQEES